MSNFKSEVIDVIVGEYVASADSGDDYDARQVVVEKLAKELEASVPQIRGVLVSQKVYVPKAAKAAAAANKGVTKEDLVKAFEASFLMDIKSMRNMTKADLEKFWARFNEMSAMREADEGV